MPDIKPVGAKPIGYFRECDTDERIIREQDSYTCQHCNFVGRKTPGSQGTLKLHWCKSCMGLICPICRTQPCDPIERKMERCERGGPFFLEDDPRRKPLPFLRQILRD